MPRSGTAVSLGARSAKSAPALPGDVRSPDPSAWRRGLLHLGLVALVVAEIALVRARFDTDRLAGDERAWARLLFATRHAAPIGIAALGAWLLIAWHALAREYAALAVLGRAPARARAWLALHALVLSGFVGLTAAVLRSLDGGALAGPGATLLWTGAAAAVPLTALAVAFQVRPLAAALRRLLPSLALALVIGLGAFVFGRAALAAGWWVPLLAATARLAHWLLAGVAGEPVGLQAVEGEGFALALGEFEVLVTRECSGFEGIALTWTFLAAYLLAFRARLRFPRALLLVPLATLLVWGLNGARLAALVWLGARVSADVALSGFHSHAGWISFCALALGVVHVSQRSAWLARVPGAALAPPREGVNPSAVYLAPLLGILATSFVTGALATGELDRLHPLRVLVGAALLWRVRVELPRVRGVLGAAGVLYGLAAFVVWVALERALGGPETYAGSELAAMGPLAAGAWLAFRLVGFVVIAPLAEELAFRGFLARRLVAADFEAVSYRALTPLAWAVSSLAFGLLHGQWLAGTLAGALYGLALVHRGRLADAVVAHGTTNALLVVYSLAVGPWYGWL